MSDFIFSTTPKPKGELTRHIHSIYHADPPGVIEFHGHWGSLAVSRNLYNGFQPYETDEHIAVVIGGPVLYFQDNHFLTNGDPVTGTKAIYRRMQQGAMQWDEDLSGPFVVLIIDKQNGQIICITDLLMFIPVYQFQKEDDLQLSTHVDALARSAGQTEKIDLVSLADFILHWIITYPYTAYKAIHQCGASAIHVFKRDEQGKVIPIEPVPYWLPEENNPYENIDQAAHALRKGLQSYVNHVANGMRSVAHFISGGEDSRSIAGILPQNLERAAFVFLDGMNREGHTAKAAAEAYGAKFHLGTRDKNHYLDILPEAADLVGSGHQYIHAHTLGFHRSCGLNKYPAVFGGFLSDTLLKDYYSRKFRGQGLIPFAPCVYISGETRSRQVNNDLFTDDVLNAITQRRRHHLRVVKQFRKQTMHEWFKLWPTTMVEGIPFLYSNRRLFCIYEPFIAKEVVKISAAVPTSWKLNRRLFNKAMRPFLRPSRFIFHVKGHLPYFPWWINVPVHFGVWFSRYLANLINPIKVNQGPWGDYNQIIQGPEWQKAIDLYAEGFKPLRKLMTRQELPQVLNDNSLNFVQKFNLMQVVYRLSTKD